MDVILHCSDSEFGNACQIDRWHREKGFSMIGYHFVILNGQITPTKYNKFFNGNIETGRPLDDDNVFEFDETAAATLGKNNCVQICLIGKSGNFTVGQIKSTADLLRLLKQIFGSIKVTQHSDHDPKNRPYCAGISKGQMDVFNSL